MACGLFCWSVACYSIFFTRLRFVSWSAICWFINCNIPEGCDVASESFNTTSIEVILPSVGHTGTTSVIQALRGMGYRSYHAEDNHIFALGTLLDVQEPWAFARSASRCQIEALSLEPCTDVFPFALRTSPKAKVILTWRDYESWRSSATASFGKDLRWFELRDWLGCSVDFLPWFFLLEAMTGLVSSALREGEPFPHDGQATVTQVLLWTKARVMHPLYPLYSLSLLFRGTLKVASQEEAYLAHMNEIRALTPPDRLLEFDVKKHGWAELGAFLGRPTPPAETPFPHPRSQSSWTNDTMFDHNKPTYLTCLAIFAVLHGINLLIVSSILRGIRALFMAPFALLRPGRSKAD